MGAKKLVEIIAGFFFYINFISYRLHFDKKILQYQCNTIIIVLHWTNIVKTIDT